MSIIIIDAKKEKRKHEALPTHRVCASCEQNLPRSDYSRNQFLGNKGPPKCRICKTSETAVMFGQTKASKAALTGRRADSGNHRRPNNFGYCNYIDKLFGLACFADIVALGVFASAKDVSESMAALQAVQRHGALRSSDESVLCLCIGDGSTPRTAVLCCFLQPPHWTCISIDPALPPEWTGQHKTVRGLTGFAGTLDEFMHTYTMPTTAIQPKHVVLLCVHTHARFLGISTITSIRARFKNVPTTLVSLPCCPKFRHV
jgi:hypothetical protein